MMPTLVAKPPQGDDWMHEAKFDGYRSQIIIDADGVRIFTRRGLDCDIEVPRSGRGRQRSQHTERHHRRRGRCLE
jgi:hypothetical protein